MSKNIAIVGGGCAGLACAIQLTKKNIPFKLFEASHELGGRVGSYHRKQLIVDKGFQVFLPSYSTAKKLLNYKSLDLCYYPRGATIITENGNEWFGLNYPKQFQSNSKVRTQWKDFLQLGVDVFFGSCIPKSPNQPSIDHFQKKYSNEFSTNFLIPFFRGVFLDPSCEKSSNQFQYYLHNFFKGGAAIPKYGMKEIPAQLAQQIPSDCIELNANVTALYDNQLIINNTSHEFKHIILATDLSTTYNLIDQPLPINPWLKVHNFILAKKSPTTLAPLTLVSKASPISHFNIPTLVSDALAPSGTHYMNVTTFENCDPKKIETEIHELTNERDWSFVWHDTIKKALPRYQLTPQISSPYVSLCGDWTTHRPSIEGALYSGTHVKRY